MKIDSVDLEDEDFQKINAPESFDSMLSYEDVKLSKRLPIVVRYDYLDLDSTPYNFMQEFSLADTQGYFSQMKKFSGKSIDILFFDPYHELNPMSNGVVRSSKKHRQQ